MTLCRFSPARRLRGLIRLPGDKSIAHRAIILSALSLGPTTLLNVPSSDDCSATLRVLRQLGIASVRLRGGMLRIAGKGLHGFRKPAAALCSRESGTTMRLFCGLLCGQQFESELTGFPALLRRPMRRITVPLRLMGARVSGRGTTLRGTREELPPLRIRGRALSGITYTLPVPSAQVKSSLLLAGLYASGKTIVRDRFKTRDHTERMLSAFRAPVSVSGSRVSIRQALSLVSPRRLLIPGDISSAGFFIVAALIVPSSEVRIDKVSLNPTRLGLVHVLRRMGARITIERRSGGTSCGSEPWGRLRVLSSSLRGTTVRAREIPLLIDELPVLMVAASCAQGATVLKGIAELRVKESDRIHAMRENLGAMGVSTQLCRRSGEDTLIIRGGRPLRGSRLRSFHDHRIAMSMAVAALAADGETSLEDAECVKKSFPEFFSVLASLQR